MFIAPFLVCFGLFWLAPFVYGIYMSLHKLSLTRGNMGFIGLQNFLDLFNRFHVLGSVFSGIKKYGDLCSCKRTSSCACKPYPCASG